MPKATMADRFSRGTARRSSTARFIRKIKTSSPNTRVCLRHLIKPTRAEIFLMDGDGSHQRQVTDNGAANWAPFVHPNNRQIIFSSNLHDPERKSFSLYSINTDGTGLERITDGARFDSFPMFSRDGRKLVFASTRDAKDAREFNIFIADWVP